MHGHGQEKPGFHGMLLLGRQTAYLSHLPMFMSPHDYQAIFEVVLSKAGIDPLAVYVRDRQENPPGSPQRPNVESKMYGFRPVINDEDEDPLTDLFVLTDLVTPADPRDPQSPPIRSSFKGDIFRGHFETFHPHEKAGPRILGDVTARVKDVVLFRKFDRRAQALPQLEYFLIGKEQELFLAHVITGPPSFDHVIGVQVVSHQFTNDELRRGMRVTFPGKADSVEQRINEQDQITGLVQTPSQHSGDSLELEFRTGANFYFETDDLEPPRGHQM